MLLWAQHAAELLLCSAPPAPLHSIVSGTGLGTWSPATNCPQTHRLVLTMQEMLQDRVKTHPEIHTSLLWKKCHAHTSPTSFPRLSYNILLLKQVNYNQESHAVPPYLGLLRELCPQGISFPSPSLSSILLNPFSKFPFFDRTGRVLVPTWPFWPIVSAFLTLTASLITRSTPSPSWAVSLY